MGHFFRPIVLMCANGPSLVPDFRGIGGLESCTVAERAQSRVFFFVTYFYNCPEAAGVALGSINGLESCTVAERAQSRVFLFVTYFYN